MEKDYVPQLLYFLLVPNYPFQANELINVLAMAMVVQINNFVQTVPMLLAFIKLRETTESLMAIEFTLLLWFWLVGGQICSGLV